MLKGFKQKVVIFDLLFFNAIYPHLRLRATQNVQAPSNVDESTWNVRALSYVDESTWTVRALSHVDESTCSIEFVYYADIDNILLKFKADSMVNLLTIMIASLTTSML